MSLVPFLVVTSGRHALCTCRWFGSFLQLFGRPVAYSRHGYESGWGSSKPVGMIIDYEIDLCRLALRSTVFQSGNQTPGGG